MTARPPSLLVRTTTGLLAANLLAALLIWLPLYVDFWKTAGAEAHQKLQRLAVRIAEASQHLGPSGTIDLPPDLTGEIAANQIRFAVLNDEDQLIAGSPGVTAPLFPPSTWRFQEYFILPATADQPELFGFARHSPIWTNRESIQITTPDGSYYFESVLDELASHLIWTGAAFVVVVLGANFLILRWALKPLRRASREAAAIGPETSSARLTQTDVPTEILPLIGAVNHGLDRLDAGYRAQRSFIADAAHELRTPLAVLRAHLDILDDRATARALESDLATMERLVSQLLAMARLEGLRIDADERVDLADLTVGLARHLAPIVIDAGRSIEVLGGETPIWVRGQADPLFRALRNLVENALRYAPQGSVVTLSLSSAPPAVSVIDHGPGVPPDKHEAIFQRFWRGERDRAASGDDGAGLGLAIVAATMKAHGGTVTVAEAAGGGAAFTLRFAGVG